MRIESRHVRRILIFGSKIIRGEKEIVFYTYGHTTSNPGKLKLKKCTFPFNEPQFFFCSPHCRKLKEEKDYIIDIGFKNVFQPCVIVSLIRKQVAIPKLTDVFSLMETRG